MEVQMIEICTCINSNIIMEADIEQLDSNPVGGLHVRIYADFSYAIKLQMGFC